MGKKIIFSCFLVLAAGVNWGESRTSQKKLDASKFKARAAKSRSVSSLLNSDAKRKAASFVQTKQNPGELSAHRLTRDSFPREHQTQTEYSDDEIDAELGTSANDRGNASHVETDSPEAHYGTPGAEEVMPDEEEAAPPPSPPTDYPMDSSHNSGQPQTAPQTPPQGYPQAPPQGHPQAPPHAPPPQQEQKQGGVIVNVVTAPSMQQQQQTYPEPESAAPIATPPAVVPDRQAESIIPPAAGPTDLTPVIQAIKDLGAKTAPASTGSEGHKIHIVNNSCGCGNEKGADVSKETELWRRVENASIKLEAIEEQEIPETP